MHRKQRINLALGLLAASFLLNVGILVSGDIRSRLAARGRHPARRRRRLTGRRAPAGVNALQRSEGSQANEEQQRGTEGKSR